MTSGKTFLGPKLRQLRTERGLTQSGMAKALGLSTSYVNLLENNQRSLSVQVLMRISQVYGVDWRDLVTDDTPGKLAELRSVLQDPVFDAARPDLQELRAALDHSPTLARSVVTIYNNYRTLTERLMSERDAAPQDDGGAMLAATPEAVVHDLFRTHRNHFAALEEIADTFFGGGRIPSDEVYFYLKTRLKDRLGIKVTTVPVAELPGTLRSYDQTEQVLRLSEGLDFRNRIFQLAHMIGLLEYGQLIDGIISENTIDGSRNQARCRVELANYFAAAVLMPYDPFIAEARECRYDLDHLAARFGVSLEQVSHRVTTLQREGNQGVPFFFLRIDKAGNVTKRFNATTIHLAEYGGACPRWDIHISFRMPGRILPQFVEMPDGSKYFTINRTVDRPTFGHQSQDHRLAITLGCSTEYASELVYAGQFQIGDPDIFTPIGINCRLCPRHACSQRAHQPIHLDLPIDEHRRGQTRFES